MIDMCLFLLLVVVHGFQCSEWKELLLPAKILDYHENNFVENIQQIGSEIRKVYNTFTNYSNHYQNYKESILYRVLESAISSKVCSDDFVFETQVIQNRVNFGIDLKRRNVGWIFPTQTVYTPNLQHLSLIVFCNLKDIDFFSLFCFKVEKRFIDILKGSEIARRYFFNVSRNIDFDGYLYGGEQLRLILASDVSLSDYFLKTNTKLQYSSRNWNTAFLVLSADLNGFFKNELKSMALDPNFQKYFFEKFPCSHQGIVYCYSKKTQDLVSIDETKTVEDGFLIHKSVALNLQQNKITNVEFMVLLKSEIACKFYISHSPKFNENLKYALYVEQVRNAFVQKMNNFKANINDKIYPLDVIVQFTKVTLVK